MTTFNTPTNHRREYKLKGTGKVIVTSELMAQIDALHKAHPGKEWSGVLVFEPICDDIVNPNDVILKALAVFPMDFGSPGYTEYELGNEILDIYEVFPEADPANGTPTLRLGQIHTHHTMGSFFSGTDDSELRDNAGKYDYYLSLIVNLSGQYVAKVAFEADLPQTIKVNGRNKGKVSEIEQDTIPILAVFDVTVVKSHGTTPEWFNKQVEVLKAKPVNNYAISEHGSYTPAVTRVNPNMPYYANKYNQQQQTPPYGTNSRVGRQIDDDDDYYNFGREYDTKKAPEKEKSETGTKGSEASSIKSPITREQIRTALPFLFQNDDNAPKLASALLIIANHKLNQETVSQEQRVAWAAEIIGKLEWWMYEHFYNELLMNPDGNECDLLEQVYDIVSICKGDAPIALTLCDALENYIVANYPGDHNFTLNND
jgi:hypothetical protein